VTTPKMIELAGKEPIDAKTGIAQLLAIRWLGEHAHEVKKDSDARTLLEEIAKGEKGKKAQGYAKDYALSVLARLDGRTTAYRRLPENSVRSDALDWFASGPADFGVLDFRKAGEFSPPDEKALRRFANSAIPPQFLEEFYKLAEKVGNLRLNRLSFAYYPDRNKLGPGRILLRFTGAADRQRLTEFLEKMLGANHKDEKGPHGEQIRLFSSPDSTSAIALIGDSELIVAGSDRPGGDHLQVLREVLKIFAGDTLGLAQGGMAPVLKEIDPLASGLFIWQPSLGASYACTALGIDSIPLTGKADKFVLVVNKKKNIEVRIKAYLAEKKDAKESVENLSQAKEKGLEGLKKYLKQEKVRNDMANLLIQIFEKIKIEAKENILTAEIDIPPELLNLASEWIDLNAPSDRR